MPYPPRNHALDWENRSAPPVLAGAFSRVACGTSGQARRPLPRNAKHLGLRRSPPSAARERRPQCRAALRTESWPPFWSRAGFRGPEALGDPSCGKEEPCRVPLCRLFAGSDGEDMPGRPRPVRGQNRGGGKARLGRRGQGGSDIYFYLVVSPGLELQRDAVEAFLQI